MLVPDWGDKVDSGIGLSHWPGAMTGYKIGWLANTTTLCQSRLYPLSQRLRICVQVSRLLEGAVVLIWHGVWTLTDILTTGMVELLLKINTKKSETSTKNDVQQFHLSLLRQSKMCLNPYLSINSRFLCDQQTVSDQRYPCTL